MENLKIRFNSLQDLLSHIESQDHCSSSLWQIDFHNDMDGKWYTLSSRNVTRGRGRIIASSQYYIQSFDEFYHCFLSDQGVEGWTIILNFDNFGKHEDSFPPILVEFTKA